MGLNADGTFGVNPPALQSGLGPPLRDLSDVPRPNEHLQVYPWWDRQLASSQDIFQKVQGVSLAANSTVIPAASIITLSAGFVAVIRQVTCFIDLPTTNLNVDFALLINGSPVAGLDKLGSFPRNAANISEPFDIIYRAPQNCQVSIRITNNNAFTWTVGASYSGWQTPWSDILRMGISDY